MNKTMVIGLSVLLCLYLAFGLIGYARAGCTWEKQPDCAAEEERMRSPPVFPNHEGTELYTLQLDGGEFATKEECEKEGARREPRSFFCVPGRGPRP